MAHVARVRVEVRRSKNDSYYEREKNFKILMKEFDRQVDEAGIKHLIKEKQYFESKSEKARRKRKDAVRKQQQEKILEAIQRGERPKGAAKLGKSKKKKNKNKNGRNSD